MRRKATLTLALAIFLIFGSTILPAQASAGEDGFAYYRTGDVSAPTPDRTSYGLMLIGGADWSPQAWKWFVEKAGNGHIVILRASQDGSDGKWVYDEIGHVASVETLVFSSREAAFDPRVAQILKRADGVFIAGGDQSNYVRFWKDTPVSAALNRHVRQGRPIGGTSAGLAILGATSYGAMASQAVDSPEALADPSAPSVTLVNDFLKVPFLEHVITDTHFTERDRLGRLIAFLAQAHLNGDSKSVGIGIDEDTALCIEADGTGSLYTTSDGHAWLVRPAGPPASASGHPLDWDRLEIVGIGTGSSINLRSMAVTAPAFSGTAQVTAGELRNVPTPTPAWSLAIHGGSGVIARGDLTSQAEQAYRQGLESALNAGAAILRKGGSSLDAVEATVRVLEDNPLFNAGRGAVFDAEGRNQLDASIMDGDTLNAGAVTGVSTTRHPVTLARAVMEQSRHVFLSGAGADEFARDHNIEQVDPSYFRTEERWRQHLEWKRANDPQAIVDPTHRFGTVGAVAMDSHGHLAAATSTGGLTGKQWGRIGDSPVIGAGTYAYDGRCAASGTGTGEYFIRETATRQVCDRVAWKGETIQEAADGTIAAIGKIGGDGGLVTMDGRGRVAFAMNTEGMYRGIVTSQQPATVGIYVDERPAR